MANFSGVGFKTLNTIFNNPKSLVFSIAKDPKTGSFYFSIKEVKPVKDVPACETKPFAKVELSDEILVCETEPFAEKKDDVLLVISDILEESFNLGSSELKISVKPGKTSTSNLLASLSSSMAREKDEAGNLKETLTLEMIAKIMFALRRNDIVTTSDLKL